jgi:proton-dependent oligopeptide transporter, POT family
MSSKGLNTKKIKQPKGLNIFCISIFFERYGFYIIQALLVLYLIQFFHTTNALAYSILGSFIALCYIMPLIGGAVADKYLGLKRTMFVGAIIEGLGMFLLVLPGMYALYFGLATIAIGMGLLKPAASSLVGFLYEKEDTRQDSGYTLFYSIFNCGIMLATFTSGYLVRYYGWQITFSSTVLALIITYFILYFGLKLYKLEDIGPNVKTTLKGSLISTVIVIICILIGYIILKSNTIAIAAFIIVCIAVICIFIYCIAKSEKEYKTKLVSFFLLLVISTIFWAMYMQMFLSITMYIKNVVNKDLLGFIIPAPAFAGLESIGVILFGYPLAKLWIALGKKKRNPSFPTKFSIGMLLLLISFGALAFGTMISGSSLVNPIWILLAYLILAVGELVLSPTGLSMVNVLVPEKFNGLMMGVFLLTIGLGGKLAGMLAQFANVPQHLQNNTAAIESIYSHAFNVYVLITAVFTIISFLLIPYINRKIKGQN